MPTIANSTRGRAGREHEPVHDRSAGVGWWTGPRESQPDHTRPWHPRGAGSSPDWLPLDDPAKTGPVPRCTGRAHGHRSSEQATPSGAWQSRSLPRRCTSTNGPAKPPDQHREQRRTLADTSDPGSRTRATGGGYEQNRPAASGEAPASIAASCGLRQTITRRAPSIRSETSKPARGGWPAISVQPSQAAPPQAMAPTAGHGARRRERPFTVRPVAGSFARRWHRGPRSTSSTCIRGAVASRPRSEPPRRPSPTESVPAADRPPRRPLRVAPQQRRDRVWRDPFTTAPTCFRRTWR